MTLEVAEPVDDGTYDRAAFPHWIDLDGDGCSTECVVLKEQAVASGAANTTGWWSSYDGKFITSVHEMQIDHVVSLKEAWISGARLWNAATREVFANDLDGELLAVSGSSNKSKGARDVAKWQPRVRAAWCDLAARVVRTKAKWRLTVDAREKSKLDEMLSTCTGA